MSASSLVPSCRRCALALALIAVSTPAASPQPAGQPVRQPPPVLAAPAIATAPGSELTVSLVTMSAGDAVWELFGHNAIWIHDAARGTDAVYNWGLFDFASPHFIPRFLLGTAIYIMGGFDLQHTLEEYRLRNRSVWAQELRLTPAQRAALRDFIEWNEQPEHRGYRYDYYRDNCSTRVRDALDRVLDGAIRRASSGVPTGTTYRWHTLRLMGRDPLLVAGADFILGEPADQPISAWEEMFLPVRLREHIRRVRVPDEQGRLVPLVVAERTLFDAARPPEPDRPPHTLLLYLLIGVLLGGAMPLLARRAARGHRGGRAALAVLAGLWSVVAGIAGLVGSAAWLVTHHVYMYANENLLQLDPLSLAVAPLVVVAVVRARGSAAFALAVVVAALSVLGLALKAFPAASQANGDIIALALPVHVGLAWATGIVLRRDATGRAAPARRPPSRASEARHRLTSGHGTRG